MNTTTCRSIWMLLAALLPGSVSVMAQRSVTAQRPVMAQRADEVRIVSSDARELVLEVTPRAGIDTLQGGALLPWIPMGDVLGGEGAEAVRMRLMLPIALPARQGNSLEIVAVEYAPAVAGRLATLAEALRRPAGGGGRIGSIEAQVEGVAELRYGGIARDLHVGEICIAPWLYDERARLLRLVRSIRLRVRYADASAERRAAVVSSAASAFLNAGVAGSWGIGSAQSFSLLRSSFSTARAWMRVDVGSEGVYALTAADFQRAGIDLASAREVVIYGGAGGDLPEKVSLADSNRLRAVPAIIERGGDGRISRLLFYGVGASRWTYREARDTMPQHAISPYVRSNSYLVAVDGEPGRQMEIAASAGAPGTFPARGIARVFVDDDQVNAIDYSGSGNGSGRIWFGAQFEVYDPSRSDVRVFETPLPGLDRDGPITYRVRAAHTGRASSNTGAGSMTVSEGSQQLGNRIALAYVSNAEEGGDVASAGDMIYSLPRADAIAGDNRSMLKLEYRSGVPARGFLDWYEIHYSRQLQAHDGSIGFEAPRGSGIAGYSIGGFTSDDLVGFDVTDAANPLRLQRLESPAGVFRFDGPLAESSRQSRRYFITQASAVRQVDGTMRAPFGDLRNRRLDAEILVITSRELLPAAERYAEYRRSVGTTTVVVPTDEIYTEFGHGRADPTAIRDYVAFAMKNWGGAPRFLLLFGGATYDYRGLIAGTRQFVPTMQSPDAGDYYNDIHSVAFDDYFARVVGDDRRNDLIAGRIPVGSVEEGESMVEKIRRYESARYFGTWRQTVIVAADDDQPQKAAGGFVGQSEEIWAKAIPDWIDTRKIYLPAYPTVRIVAATKPEAARDLDQFLRRGALMTTWIGHGNPKVWAHENLLERDRLIPTLRNDTALTFVMAATCNFGSFDSRERSGAELFVLNPSGGAIGVLASTRASYTGPNSRMSLEYVHQTFNRDPSSGHYPTIGEALYNVKQSMGDASVDNNEKYHILGDPALRLNVPVDRVVVTAINGVAPSDSSPPLGALSLVTVEGEVQGVAGLREDFNGHAIISLYEADRSAKLAEQSPFGTYHHNVLLSGGRLFQGPAKIVGGRFSGTFRVPMEISFTRAKGRLLVYAFDERGDAAGATREVRIYGADTAVITDRRGPEIRVFLDDRTFRAGDMVTSSPLLIVELTDSSGINSSTAGLGHGIEAFLDGDPVGINLTDRYQTLPTSYQSGSAERRLDSLSPGRHELRVRAWDIFNNPTEITTYFRVTERDDRSLDVVDVVNIPNPMSRRTAFTFRHNQTRPLDVDIAIYTVTGRRVRSLSARGITDRLAQVEWDGADADGSPLANGVYLYRLRVTVDEEVFETIEKVVVMR